MTGFPYPLRLAVAGALLMALLPPSPLPAADDGAEAAPPQSAAATPAADPAQSTDLSPTVTSMVSGPAILTLGAQARLDLPPDWRWVAQEQLGAYFAASGRRSGRWDLGVALAPGSPAELRLQFEPLGAVNDADPSVLAPDALMARLEQAEDEANQRRRALGLPEARISAWVQAPGYDPAKRRLQWSELHQVGADEVLGWHARLLGREGVIKLDLVGPQAALLDQTPQAQALVDAVAFQAGKGLDLRQPTDKASPLGLDALVVDGASGRGALAGGAPPEPASLWAQLALWLAGAALAVWAALTGSRAWMAAARRKARQAEEEARLERLEKELGGRAEDVEEILEDDEHA